MLMDTIMFYPNEKTALAILSICKTVFKKEKKKNSEQQNLFHLMHIMIRR